VVKLPSPATRTVTLTFLNPRRAPVGGLALAAQVHLPTGQSRSLQSLRTNAQGRVQLDGVSAPSVIDLEIKNSEWRLANPRFASLIVSPQKSGFGLAAVPEADKALPSHRLRLASLRMPRGVAQNVGNAERVVPIPLLALSQRRQSPASTQAIEVERTVVDLEIAAPAGSEITTPALSRSWSVPSSGRLPLRLPLEVLRAGAVPLRVARRLPGGESEAVITSYERDAYKRNFAKSPPLQLVSLSQIEVAPGVTSTREDVTKLLGDLRGKANKKNVLGTAVPLPDGSEWWVYKSRGLGFKMRALPVASDKQVAKGFAPMMVERVHIFGNAKNSVAGVSLGATVGAVHQQWGQPQVTNAPRLPSDAHSDKGQIDSYLDGGLRLCHDGNRVLWMELARSNALLQSGTTAFVPRARARLFVESFRGHPRTNLRNIEEFKGFLRQLASVEIVGSRAEADFVLNARIAEFFEDKDKVIDLIPYRYDCRTRLVYSLFDNTTSQYIAREKEAVGLAKADYTKEALIAGIGGVGLARKKGLAGLLGAAILGGSAVGLQRSVQRATNNCPAFSLRTACDQMVRDIDGAANFQVRVTAIDYAKNTLTINAGSRSGVRVSKPGQPFDFAVSSGNLELPHAESPKHADYYAARVISVGESFSVCQLRHLKRYVKKTSEALADEAAPAMLRRLPDPATGLVQARAAVRFPPVTVISDADVQNALKAQSKNN
jgi:hypothetical protein